MPSADALRKHLKARHQIEEEVKKLSFETEQDFVHYVNENEKHCSMFQVKCQQCQVCPHQYYCSCPCQLLSPWTNAMQTCAEFAVHTLYEASDQADALDEDEEVDVVSLLEPEPMAGAVLTGSRAHFAARPVDSAEEGVLNDSALD